MSRPVVDIEVASDEVWEIQYDQRYLWRNIVGRPVKRPCLSVADSAAECGEAVVAPGVINLLGQEVFCVRGKKR